MSRNTPWSTLPSDRIKPTNKASPNVARPKGKAKQQQPDEPPRSPAVRRLDALIAAARSSSATGKDPAGGCFCLARTHPLSSYAPLCAACGLILCSVNPPHFACPHCSAPLLATSAARAALVDRLEAELAAQVEKEAADRERAIEEAQRAAGAFPSLSGAPSASQFHAPVPTAPPPSRQTHKVMSLTSGRRGGAVRVSSYTTTPVASRPTSRTGSPRESPEEQVQRVPPPAPQPPHALQAPSAQRPWENMLDGPISYKPPARLGGGDEASTSRRRKRNKKKVDDESLPETGHGSGSDIE